MIRSQWVNIDDEGALPALLRRIAARVTPDAIDGIWIFPTRRGNGAESTVIAIAAFDQDRTRRRVGAVRFLVTRDRKGAATVTENLDEYASAPPDAVPRIIDGVLRRLEHENAAPPRHERIEGDPARWDGMLARLADPSKSEKTSALIEADISAEDDT
jgi:hypothetical protein